MLAFLQVAVFHPPLATFDKCIEPAHVVVCQFLHFRCRIVIVAFRRRRSDQSVVIDRSFPSHFLHDWSALRIPKVSSRLEARAFPRSIHVIRFYQDLPASLPGKHLVRMRRPQPPIVLWVFKEVPVLDHISEPVDTATARVVLDHDILHHCLLRILFCNVIKVKFSNKLKLPLKPISGVLEVIRVAWLRAKIPRAFLAVCPWHTDHLTLSIAIFIAPVFDFVTSLGRHSRHSRQIDALISTLVVALNRQLFNIVRTRHITLLRFLPLPRFRLRNFRIVSSWLR